MLKLEDTMAQFESAPHTAEALSQSNNSTSQFGERVKIVLALLAVYIIWGSTYLGLRIGLEGFPPFLLLGIRFFIAGALLYGILRLQGHAAPTRPQWKGATILGLFLLIGGNGTVTIAEQWVSSGLAALVVATMPLWVALFSGLLGRWPGWVEWLGLALGFVGIILLNFEGDMQSSPLGALILVGSAASWAFGTVWSRRLTLPEGMMASAAEMLTASPLLIIGGLLMGEQITEMPGIRPIGALVYLIVAALIAFSAYNYLLQKVRPSVATSYAYVNPVVAVGLGIWLANEHIGLMGLIAMPIILSGVALVLFNRKG
jgi:drug/metabolite transporter (DMT)-like permease